MDRIPSVPIRMSAVAVLPSSKRAVTPLSVWSAATNRLPYANRMPSATARSCSTRCSSARCTTRSGGTPANVGRSMRRRPTASALRWIGVAIAVTASSAPIVRRAATPLGASASVPPMPPTPPAVAGYASYTVAVMPARCSASAVTGPAMPPPMTIAVRTVVMLSPWVSSVCARANRPGREPGYPRGCRFGPGACSGVGSR